MSDFEIRSLVLACAEEFGEHVILNELVNHLSPETLSAFLASMEGKEIL